MNNSPHTPHNHADPKASMPPRPKKLSEIPAFLSKLLGGFFSRFGYILKIVWKTGPWILFSMMFISVFQGVTPVIGSIISKEIINELQILLKDGFADTDFFASSVFFLIVFLFIYRFLHQLVGTVSAALNRIAGEKVVSQVKLQIMNKTKASISHPSICPNFTKSLRTPTVRRATDRYPFFRRPSPS